MKSFKYSLVILLLVSIFGSCKKEFDDFDNNINQPENVPPSLLLRNILNHMQEGAYTQAERNGQYTCCNYTYYGDNLYWDGTLHSQYASLDYGTLNDVVNMEKIAKKITGTDKNPYAALGKFLRAYYFVRMSLKVGDLPMTEALQGLTNKEPKYDTQKQIFKQCLSLLDESNADLSNLITNGFLEFSGDFYFKERINNPLAGGNGQSALIAWQKVVNTFRLRVLIHLSKHADDGELNVKQQFASIVNDPVKYPIMESSDDNLQYVYNDKFNFYGSSPNNYGNDALRYNMAATYLNTLAGLHDLRAMIVAEPARGLGFADTSYASFVGAPSGQDLSTMAAIVQAGKYSLINRYRYYETLVGENTFIISYQEMCFNITEAINRGWVGGNAEDWYKKGIKSMQNFYGIKDGLNTVKFQKGGVLGEDISYSVYFNFDQYYNQNLVKYSGDNTNGLKQILTQRYLSLARNSGLEGYYQYRRTGIPQFDAGPGTGNSGIIPIRFQYPVNELSTNGTNYSAAIQSQYGGNDGINQAMWLIK